MPGASRGKWSSWTLNSEAFSAARREQLPKACALFFDFPSSQPRALGDWRGARIMRPNVNRKKTARCPPSSEPSVSAFLHTQQNSSLFQGIPSLFSPQGISASICPQPGLPALPRGGASHRGTPCLSFMRLWSPGLSGAGKLQYTVASSCEVQRGK